MKVILEARRTPVQLGYSKFDTDEKDILINVFIGNNVSPRRLMNTEQQLECIELQQLFKVTQHAA